jgi:alkane 1-monooxygenase
MELFVIVLLVVGCSGITTLWDRMGGEAKIRPLCDDLYEMHATDPLTAKWFGPHVQGNKRTAEQVKENVFTFFSAGIGGPHTYKGNNMKAAHAHMRIDRHAFHALTNHVLVGMEKHQTGGPAEREEVYDILMSLRLDVMHGTENSTSAKPKPKPTQSLWERMGGESKIRPLCNELYEMHTTDPLTASWFGPHVQGNKRTAEQVKENVFTFFSAGIGGPHTYKGNDLKAAHAHMKIDRHAFHALTNHVLVGMEKHQTGGPAEREEVYDILMSLRPDVMHGTETESLHPTWQAAASFMVVFLLLVLWRQREALDSSKNNLGLLQWSSVFYREGGLLTDFINGLPYILNLAPTATVFAGIYLRSVTGNDWFAFTTFVVGFGAVPLADLIIGEDSYNPTKEEEAKLRANFWFSFHLCAYVWCYVASVIAIAYYVGVESGFVDGSPNKLSMTAFWGIATSLGISSGFGIGCIHELIHRPTFTELYHARVVLLFSNYNHFWVEHLWGHHKRVATDEDPASSALNEPLWTFIVKCWYQSFLSACRLEAKFQGNRGRSWLSIHNRILYPFLCSFAIDYAIYHFWGPMALALQIVQSLLTAFLTDNANYIEHYGLRRERKSDRKDDWGLYNDYEKPGWMHAWNTGDRITNWMLFKIERHPDHHVNAGRPYQILRTFKESPTYPTGYAGMFVLSWFPPLFFYIMNPLVKKAHEDYQQQLKDGTYSKIFPSGANNISSVYKKVGEDFFVKGSSEYADGADSQNSESAVGVWGATKDKTS